jgi:hypothetical protein
LKGRAHGILFKCHVHLHGLIRAGLVYSVSIQARWQAGVRTIEKHTSIENPSNYTGPKGVRETVMWGIWRVSGLVPNTISITLILVPAVRLS